MKSWFTKKDRLLAGTIIAGASVMGLAAPAVAQDEAGPAEEEIVVTGSRIPAPNLITTSPVTQVTSEDVMTQGVTRIEDLINQLPQAFAAQNSTVSNGASGTAEVNLRGLGSQRTLVLVDGRRMPYGTPFSAAADINQIPSGVVDRVEILTGGASAVYGSDAVAGVVNFIMKDDFEGVQVDGQYSFYQHNNDFEGPGAVKLRDVIAGRAETNPSQFRLPDDDVVDGYGKQFTILMGVNSEDGRGNVTAYAAYATNDSILQANRDYSACALGANPTVSFSCGGSGTAFPGTFTDFVTFAHTIDSATGNTVRDFDSERDQYNFGPLNYYQRPDERYSLGAFAHYEVNRHFEVYAQFMFTDSATDAQIAPSGNFFSTGTINCAGDVNNPENPLLSANQFNAWCEQDRVIDIVDDPETAWDEVDDFINGIGREEDGTPIPPDEPLTPEQIADNQLAVGNSLGTQACTFDDAFDPNDPDDAPAISDPRACPLYIGRRNVEGGGRDDTLRFESYRAVLGVRGELVAGWDYDVSGTFARNQLSEVYLNDFSTVRLTRALDVVRDPEGGEPVCRSVLDGTDANCVPYDIFTLGNVTPEALAYLQTPGVLVGTMDQQVVTGVVTGDLGTHGIQSPFAETGVQTAFGFEYRRDALKLVTDTAFSTGDLAGQGGATIGLSGSTDVVELFGELRVPLIEEQPFAHLVSLDLAYRYSDYNTGVTTDTYKIGADWAPTEDIRFRGSYQRAVRAPNVIELFTAQGFNLFDLDGDPCGAALEGTAAAASDADCLATGVPQALLRSSALDSPAGQYNFLQGGNPDLQPEIADTFTAGIVLTPTFLSGLSVSVDWFNIKIEDTISTFGAANTLDACYQFDDAAACSRINRNDLGQLWVGTGNVVDLNTNIGGLETSGVDVNANYRVEIGDQMGALNFNMTGTYLIDLLVDPGAEGFPVFDCTGVFGGGCNDSSNSARGTPNPEWRHRIRVGWETPWSGLELAGTWRYYGEAELLDGDPNRIDFHFDPEHYFDLAGRISITENAVFRVGVNNVLDNDPPLSASVGTTGNGNTYPQTYDAFGRYVFAGVTLDF